MPPDGGNLDEIEDADIEKPVMWHRPDRSRPVPQGGTNVRFNSHRPAALGLSQIGGVLVVVALALIFAVALAYGQLGTTTTPAAPAAAGSDARVHRPRKAETARGGAIKSVSASACRHRIAAQSTGGMVSVPFESSTVTNFGGYGGPRLESTTGAGNGSYGPGLRPQ